MNPTKHLALALTTSLLFAACSEGVRSPSDQQKPEAANENQKIQAEADQFLSEYNKKYQELLAKSNEAEWALNTHIVKGDTVTKQAAEEANSRKAKFVGSKENTDRASAFLKQKNIFTPIQTRQFEYVLYMGAEVPEAAGELVKEKIAADAEQTKQLFGFNFTIDGKPVTANDMDRILSESKNLSERLKAWEASKEVGKPLKPGLVKLRDLRNKCVQALSYPDFFSYQVSEYGMSSEEMRKVCQQMIRDIWPLYRELHTYARYTLAERYKQPVPDKLPAHWLTNRWGQDWSGLVTVEGLDLDKELKTKSAEWIVKEGEKFYMSLGFDALPQTFYEKSSLYPLPKDAGYKKNNHASAWHFDNDKDVRSLMSVEPNTRWWGTTLHELGHIYYYITYSNPDVPVILRNGANRGYHEAMGSLMGLAATQKPFLTHLSLLPENTKTNERDEQTQTLLKEALEYIVVIPWGAGVMTEFEYELYANNLPNDQFNRKWWELVGKFQGIVPPAKRGEEFCDAASKTHINNDPAQYYDYAISFVLLFQFHEHISKNILKQDPHSTNYYGSKDVGAFLKTLMYPGASVNWTEHLKKHLGSDMSARSLVNYFAPLMDYLKTVNNGRTHTIPEML